MGYRGDSYNKTIRESFFGPLESELLDRRRLRARAEVKIAVFYFIGGFQNHAADNLRWAR